MRKTKLAAITALTIVMALLCTAGGLMAAGEPSRHQIGEAGINLSGPGGKHSWVDKNSDLGIKLAPSRYSSLIRQILSVYSYNSFNSPGKAYNNHCAIFFVGPADKVWNTRDFALLKTHLLPRAALPEGEELEAEAKYLQAFLKNGMDFKISSGKARKYYTRLQKSEILREHENSVALTLRHKKKKEKAKQITMSLALVNGKLIGTVYYQVDPGRKERARAADLTLAWQDALLKANGSRPHMAGYVD